mmetsp:Transcript_19974/g.49043  ORF Transcript_19974/g.49043 Transcript_19974/m.49043 type:complete len:212 (+) Transcript_19974:495-1130(+)
MRTTYAQARDGRRGVKGTASRTHTRLPTHTHTCTRPQTGRSMSSDLRTTYAQARDGGTGSTERDAWPLEGTGRTPSSELRSVDGPAISRERRLPDCWGGGLAARWRSRISRRAAAPATAVGERDSAGSTGPGFLAEPALWTPSALREGRDQKESEVLCAFFSTEDLPSSRERLVAESRDFRARDMKPSSSSTPSRIALRVVSRVLLFHVTS